MKPGDLVRVNIPESARSVPSYYFHDYIGLVIETADKGLLGWPVAEVILGDGTTRRFNQKYLEAVDEAR